MASARGRVVRIDETPSQRELRLAQKAVDALEFALERARIAEERASQEVERLEIELAQAQFSLGEVNRGNN